MTALYIFLGIILLLILALFLSVSVTITYETADGEEDSLAIYKIHYGPFKIFPKSDKKKVKKNKIKKPKKVKNKKEPIKNKQVLNSKPPSTDKKQNTSPKIKTTLKSKKKTTDEKVDFEIIKTIIKSAFKPVTRLFGKIRIKSLSIHCIAGGEDAAKVAINYGIYCTAVYGLTTWLGNKIKVSADELKVTADFDRKETYLFMRMKIKLSVGAAVIHFLWFLKRFSSAHSQNKKSQAKGKEE